MDTIKTEPIGDNNEEQQQQQEVVEEVVMTLSREDQRNRLNESLERLTQLWIRLAEHLSTTDIIRLRVMVDKVSHRMSTTTTEANQLVSDYGRLIDEITANIVDESDNSKKQLDDQLMSRRRQQQQPLLMKTVAEKQFKRPNNLSVIDLTEEICGQKTNDKNNMEVLTEIKNRLLFDLDMTTTTTTNASANQYLESLPPSTSSRQQSMSIVNTTANDDNNKSSIYSSSSSSDEKSTKVTETSGMISPVDCYLDSDENVVSNKWSKTTTKRKQLSNNSLEDNNQSLSKRSAATTIVNNRTIGGTIILTNYVLFGTYKSCLQSLEFTDNMGLRLANVLPIIPSNSSGDYKFIDLMIPYNDINRIMCCTDRSNHRQQQWLLFVKPNRLANLKIQQSLNLLLLLSSTTDPTDSHLHHQQQQQQRQQKSGPNFDITSMDKSDHYIIIVMNEYIITDWFYKRLQEKFRKEYPKIQMKLLTDRKACELHNRSMVCLIPKKNKKQKKQKLKYN